MSKKKKHKVTLKSLENLKLADPQNNFNNSDVAREAQKKSVEARKTNQTMKQVAQEKLWELMSNGKTFQENAFERLKLALLSEGTKPAELVKILEFLRDTSGQKPVEKHDFVNDCDETRRAYLEAMRNLSAPQQRAQHLHEGGEAQTRLTRGARIADKVGEQQIQQEGQSISGETA